MNSKLFIFIYNLFYFLSLILLKLVQPFLGHKLKQWIKLRDNNLVLDEIKKRSDFKNKNEKRIWFHVSSGEIEYIKGPVRELKKSNPYLKIFISYSSPSAIALLKSLESEIEFSFPLGWDLTSQNEKFIQTLNPHALIFAKTDLWPNLVFQASKNKIPLICLSAYFKNLIDYSFIKKLFFNCVYSKLSLLTVVNSDVETILILKKWLPKANVQTQLDTRYDQVFYRLSQNSKIQIIKESLSSQIITLGSTWPEDDNVLLKCLSFLIEKNFKIIWAPHDIHKNNILIQKIKKLNSSLQVRNLSEFIDSENQSPFIVHSSSFQILMIDRIGYLADIYRFSDISFVGGSFVKNVHSVMEPICAGSPVLLGPYFNNSPEATEFMSSLFLKSFRNENEFKAHLQDMISQPQLKKIILDQLNTKKGGSKISSDLILALI